MPEPVLQAFFYYFGIVPARYSHPEWAVWVGLPLDDYWPFVTSMFLHGGWLHIIGNMWTLWIFGDNVEDRMGTTRFLDVLLSFAAWPLDWCTISPTLTPPFPPWELPALSPGCSALTFCSFPNSRVITLIPLFFLPLFVEVPAITYLGFWLLSQIFSGVLSLGSTRGRRRSSILGSRRRLHCRRGAALVFVKGRRNFRALSPDEWGLEGSLAAA